jgi:hypothetical protein
LFWGPPPPLYLTASRLYGKINLDSDKGLEVKWEAT